MGWIIGIFTTILIVDCLFLILLVLIQLPKKEAGLGTAFGGGATDALFGAGSGNALTKMTKYSTGIFFGLTLTLSVLNAQNSKLQKTRFQKTLDAIPAPQMVPPVAPPTSSNSTITVPGAPTNSPLTTTSGAPASATTPPSTPPNAPEAPSAAPAATPPTAPGTPPPPAEKPKD